ncbi:MAG: hypothetical protein MR037_02540 [Bacteroidales bacterium]|nr:hypothetical protein [Bacteroidales bacterium]
MKDFPITPSDRRRIASLLNEAADIIQTIDEPECLHRARRLRLIAGEYAGNKQQS